MKRIVAALALLLVAFLIPDAARAQSPCLYVASGAVLTPAQWNFCFQQKADVPLGGGGFLPLSGGSMTGKLVTLAATTNGAGLNLPAGTAPLSPVNGDMWSTATGLFAQINGVTIQLGTIASASTNDLAVYTSPTAVGGTGTITIAGTTITVTGQSVGTCANSLTLNSSHVIVLASCPGAAASVTVGTTTITSGTSGRILYDNAAVLGEATVTGSLGSVVLSGSPIINTPTLAGLSSGICANGIGINASNAVITVACPGAAASITVGTTTISGGTSGRILFDNAAVLGEATITGSLGSVVLSNSPTIASLTVTGVFTATGLVTNADLVNSSITLAGTSISLGGSVSTLIGSLTINGTLTMGNSITVSSGNLTLSAGTVLDTSAGNGTNNGAQFGSAGGSQTAAAITNTNILLYNLGTTNWSGIGVDTGGNQYYTVVGSVANGWFWVNVTGAGVSSAVANMSHAGGLTVAGCTGCTSDERLKRDPKTLTCKDVEGVDALRPVSFNWRHVAQLPDRVGWTHYGVLAQEAREVFPDLVYRDVATDLTPDGTYEFNYEELIPILVKKIQCLERARE